MEWETADSVFDTPISPIRKPMQFITMPMARIPAALSFFSCSVLITKKSSSAIALSHSRVILSVTARSSCGCVFTFKSTL